jgi:hypothetical protein
MIQESIGLLVINRSIEKTEDSLLPVNQAEDWELKDIMIIRRDLLESPIIKEETKSH